MARGSDLTFPGRQWFGCDTGPIRGSLAWLALIPLLFLCSNLLAKEPDAAAEFRKSIQPILSEYCYDCHGDGEKKGNVTLDDFTSDDALLHNPELWQKVLKNVRAGIMPPQKKPRPNVDEKKELADWIKYGAFGIDPKNPDPGRVTLRRLNRVEYRNTIRDLMGIDYNTTEEFPPDDTGYGFDTIGDVLSISPLLLEKYMQAAESIVKTAVPTVAKVAPEIVIDGRRFRDPEKAAKGAPERSSRRNIGGDRLSFYKEASVAAAFKAPHDGDYEIAIEVAVDGSFNFDPGQCTVAVKLDGQELSKDSYKWQNHKTYRYNLKYAIQQGDHHLSFELHPLAESAADRQTSVDFRVISVKVTGPLDPKLWRATPNYLRFFPREQPPTSPEERREYAREVLRAFATKAFRRPVDDATLDRLVKIAEAVYSEPGKKFEEGVGEAMVAVLSSPRFLFRVEQTLPEDAGKPFARIDEDALASRLSYFLWSTMPDEELTRLAREGKLRANLDAQVKRMLADSRSDNLIRNFIGQWMQVRDVEGITIDARTVLAQDKGIEKELQREIAAFRARVAEQQRLAKLNGGRPATRPSGQFRRSRLFQPPAVELDSQLRAAMEQEAELYFGYVVQKDRSVLDLLSSDYTFVNEKLAKLYGIPNVTGTGMRRVELPSDSPRGGLLTMGSTLVITSNPTRTSPVKRGQFILDNILGMPAPPPPANLPPLESSDKGSEGHELSFRQVLEIHRDHPLCKSCHARMDPLGLSLENFNALGMWREKERGQAIDPSGTLLTGESFHGIRELKQILVENHRMDFYRCLTEKLLTYALGRGIEYYDTETVDQIVSRLDREGGRFSALLMGVIESSPFQERRTSSAPANPPSRPPEQRVQNQGGHEQRPTG